jgi:aldehyde:ferredoxin oxidoreductase
MTDLNCTVEEAPPAYQTLAGRALTSTLVSDEVPPLCHPLGPNNKLVFSPGIATGTNASTSSRISVGAKSPLTGGIKESNAGSSWASDLGRMQIKALVVEGKLKEVGKRQGASVTWDAAAGKPKVEFFDAAEYAGKDLYDVYPKIYERFGGKFPSPVAAWQENTDMATRAWPSMICPNVRAGMPDVADWAPSWEARG